MMWSRSHRSTQSTSNVMSVGLSLTTTPTESTSRQGSSCNRDRGGRSAEDASRDHLSREQPGHLWRLRALVDGLVELDTAQLQVVDDPDRVAVLVEELAVLQMQPGV